MGTGAKKKVSKTKRLKDAAFREVNKNTPAQVKRTRRKQGKKKAEKMRTAIALDKARSRGARIPRR